MAGHSQFKNIMHRKGRQDAVRGRIFSRISREITVAAKGGSKNLEENPRLRAAVQAAKAENMPKDRIERAIQQAISAKAGENYEEVRYEGYAPGGVALIVEAMTDNRNRTASDIRTILTKNGGSMAETGSATFLFKRIGIIEFPPAATNADAMFEAAAEIGAEDTSWDSEEGHSIICDPSHLHAVSRGLEEKFGPPTRTHMLWIPLNPTPIEGESAEKLTRLMEMLDDHDDVQSVWVNATLPS